MTYVSWSKPDILIANQYEFFNGNGPTAVITAFADAGGGQVTVTSANSFINGESLTISGTDNYNGIFTVANAAPSNFEITATWVSDDAKGAWHENNSGASWQGLFAMFVSAGWTLWDDRSGVAGPYKVWYSDGESGTEPRFYIKCNMTGSGALMWYIYRWWNNVTHTGSFEAYCDGYMATSQTGFNAHCYLDKDVVFITTVVGSGTDTLHIGLTTDYYSWAFRTATTGAVTAGSSVVIPVTDSSNFEVNSLYQILNNDPLVAAHANTEMFVCEAKAAGQITAATLGFSYASGAVVGNCPRSVCIKNGTVNSWYFLEYTGNTPYADSNTGRMTNNYTYYLPGGYFLLRSYVNKPMALKWAMGYDFNLGGFGVAILPGTFSSQWKLVWGDYSTGSSQHNIFQIETEDNLDVEGGRTTGGNAGGTLNDTAKSWAVNSLIGKTVAIVSGLGIGYSRTIDGNTATQLSVTPNWTTTPNESGVYQIYSSSTGTTANTLTDSSKAWTVNEWAGKLLYIISGTGAGQLRKIASNTATALTLTVDFDVIPSAIVPYVISTKAYRTMPVENSTTTDTTGQWSVYAEELGE